ncbi:MAG TPA: HEAT repeat domain-containing protein [Pirellulales bacterium]|nr:HEAT repeat domain-containing protein [Pirellulales bacterium]
MAEPVNSSDSANGSGGPSPPDHGLPPVEPPSARFILQLFVVPAVIVILIVMVWMLFNWLAQMGSDPTKYVAALRSNSKARWQAAASLADILNDKRNVELKRDPRLAQDLASLLTDELKEPNEGEEQEMLEIYLCRALGEFSVPEAVPALLEAAARTRPEDIAVRRAALEGLTVLASHLAIAETPYEAQVDQALASAASDQDAQIRSVAAFALGVLGDKASLEHLRQMLSDTYPDVRYNAATGLARCHDAAGMEVILEMLDPEEQKSLKLESAEESREFKRALIAENGLQAALALFEHLPEADRRKLHEAIERLADKEQPADIRLKATEVLRRLDEGSVKAPAA